MSVFKSLMLFQYSKSKALPSTGEDLQNVCHQNLDARRYNCITLANPFEPQVTHLSHKLMALSDVESSILTAQSLEYLTARSTKVLIG